MTGSVAAAFILLLVIGAAAGLVQVRLGGPGSEATLTSVTGCSRLEQASGTLERVNGDNVVIRTASGQLVTASTTATTRLAASGALLGDVTDGAPVTVAGTSSDATIAADYVVGASPSLHVPGVVTVRGTVTGAGTAGFTVVTSAGTRVAVTTSADTVVTVFHASPGQLQAGASTMALGYAGPNGTLSALGVLQPPNWPAGAHATASVKGCSSTAINHEILALASGG